MIIVTPILHQNNISRSDKKILQKAWIPEQYAKFMFEPNPIAPIQIPIWDSRSNDDELREDNIGHDDDAHNNVDEENRIHCLLESLYVHVDDEERDVDKRDDDLERDIMYNSSKNKLYEGTNTTVLSMILLLMNIKAKYEWLDTSFTSLLRFEFYFVL